MIILGIFSCIWISKGRGRHASFFAQPTSKSASWSVRYAVLHCGLLFNMDALTKQKFKKNIVMSFFLCDLYSWLKSYNGLLKVDLELFWSTVLPD